MVFKPVTQSIITTNNTNLAKAGFEPAAHGL